MKGDVAFYTDITEPNIELRKTLSMSVTPPSKTSKLYKVRCKIVAPVADAVTGLLSHSNTADFTFLLPKQSLTTERTGLLLDVSELIAHAVVEEQVVALAPIY
jgi:hypothetical protein